MFFRTRISYNSEGWQRPTGDASKLEGKKSFNALFGFGFEDWLFRGEWQVNGWRYAFLQEANIKSTKYIGTPLDLVLYTILPDKRRRWVANVHDVECLSSEQSRDAQALFREQGWLQQMEREVARVNGKPEAIHRQDYSRFFLNVRYRVEHLEILPVDTFLPRNVWVNRAAYYKFYALDENADAGIPPPLRERPGRNDPLDIRPIFRRGTAPLVFTPEHRRMQATLLAQLQAEYGAERVRIEVDGIDVLVETDNERRLYEIKTDLCPRSVIRQALGQILEYAFHRPLPDQRPVRLIIVGRSTLGAEDRAYLEHLRQAFHLPLEYLALPL